MFFNRPCSTVRRDAVAGIVSLLLTLNTHGQTSKVGAILQGTVSDTSGAVVPNATLTINNVLTNQTRSVTTDDQGFFRASQLAVGTYRVRLAHPGLLLIGAQTLA